MSNAIVTPTPSVAAILEEDILFGRLRPRERLVEDELMERIGATRHAVRHALLELEAMGVVVRVPNKGAQVRDFTRAEIDEICRMRDLLHQAAVLNIPLPVDQSWVDSLEKLQRAHSAAVAKCSPIDIHRTNNAFHDALYAGSCNRYLAKTIHEYAQLSLPYRCHLMTRIDKAENAELEHRAMIECLRSGDISGLANLCVKHTRPARDVYAAIQGWPT
ncbi:MAG: hypothetical protein RL682_1639 [Pseudomonadota bacterium]|jgi:DNA-binding GntR family transcriptional regulator